MRSTEHFRRSLTIVLLLLNCLYLSWPHVVFSAEIRSTELIEIKTRPGVTQKFILTKPEKPIASLILFEGGMGQLSLGKFFGKPYVGAQDGRITVLGRSMEDFAKAGLVTVYIDAPSDRQRDGLNPTFRTSEEHILDIKALVSYLRNETDLPVWLAGISYGAFSAANGAAHINNEISGFVLLSAVTRQSKQWPQTVPAIGLENVTVPALLIYHKDDQCPDTPASGAPRIADALVKSVKAEMVYLSGGNNFPNPRAPAHPGCQAMTYHGFSGIEKQVVSTIAEFIKSNSSEGRKPGE